MNVDHPPLGTQPSNQTVECFLCGYSLIYKGSRFCSDRCRQAFDAGHSHLDPNQGRAFCALPLDRWRIVAGPPATTIGASYYGPFLGQAQAARRPPKVRNAPPSVNSIDVENSQANSRTCRGTFAEGRSAAAAAERRQREAAP
jgi:hypothetical protein